ncbi:MAG: hypothetical protein Ctma_1591 [Catillopecten margaritatus gill symbiont]|uniref:UbiA prenyltransferase family protein n=1 Tax=Catillopecten margaritatus gill symbiont TaxID=3083288 RepID=A0AAU6PIL0_9GAMM
MIPLIVDLDHTLIDTDLLQESSKGVLKSRPWLIFMFPIWFMRGKGHLKEQLVKRFNIDVSKLPYNQTTIDYIKQRKKQGDKIILATASHKFYAFAVAKHIKLFDDVMASNKNFNLSSHNKAAKLVERFGNKGFDYMGDHNRDIPVWEVSNLAILTNVSESLIKKTRHLNRLILSKKI